MIGKGADGRKLLRMSTPSNNGRTTNCGRRGCMTQTGAPLYMTILVNTLTAGHYIGRRRTLLSRSLEVGREGAVAEVRGGRLGAGRRQGALTPLLPHVRVLVLRVGARPGHRAARRLARHTGGHLAPVEVRVARRQVDVSRHPSVPACVSPANRHAEGIHRRNVQAQEQVNGNMT